MPHTAQTGAFSGRLLQRIGEGAMPASPVVSMNPVMNTFISWIEALGIHEPAASLAAHSIALMGILLLAVVVNWIAKRMLLRVVDQIVSRTPWRVDDALRDNQVFLRLSHLAPAIVINLLGKGVFYGSPFITSLISAMVMVYVVVVILMVASAVLNTIQQYIEVHTEKNIPIKGFVQATKLVLFIVGAILVLSIIFGRSPLFFLSGFGALTAVLLLVFRDALLGLVAGIMISVNQMIRVGDWIEMPSNGADGDVIDVSLTTVKVRNWDRTITTVPSYDLISKSFKNWRGMYENRGRRIKRAMFIDLQTVDFVNKELLERLQRIRRLKPYLEAKLKEVEEANKQYDLDMDVLCNHRRLTNLGTFRAYCIAYLRDHPGILQTELIMVRQLDPGQSGLPLEIYAFTNDTAWTAYEGIQSDIFDHLFSVVGEFGLRVFQAPSGLDMRIGLQRLGDVAEEMEEPKV